MMLDDRPTRPQPLHDVRVAVAMTSRAATHNIHAGHIELPDGCRKQLPDVPSTVGSFSTTVAPAATILGGQKTREGSPGICPVADRVALVFLIVAARWSLMLNVASPLRLNRLDHRVRR